MSSDYDSLRDLMEDHGMSRDDADKGTKSCLKSMVVGATKLYLVGGAILYFMNTNPTSAFGYGTIAVDIGAGDAVLNSDECTRVRQALDFWSTVTE